MLAILSLAIFISVGTGQLVVPNQNPYAYLAQLGSGLDLKTVLPEEHYEHEVVPLGNLELSNLHGQLGNIHPYATLLGLQALGLLPVSTQSQGNGKPSENTELLLQLLRPKQTFQGIFEAEDALHPQLEHHYKNPYVQSTPILVAQHPEQERPLETLDIESFLEHHRKKPNNFQSVPILVAQHTEQERPLDTLDMDSLLADLRKQTSTTGQNMHQETYAWGRNVPVLRHGQDLETFHLHEQPQIRQPFTVKKPHHFEIYHYV